MRAWNPIKEMQHLNRELDHVFRHFTPQGWDATGAWTHRGLRPSEPRLQVTEDDENVVVEALAPGLDPESIDISMEGDLLMLSAKREQPQEEDMVWHRRERTARGVEYSMRLRRRIDADRIEAQYQQGVLRVTLPRSEADRPRRIEVKG